MALFWMLVCLKNKNQSGDNMKTKILFIGKENDYNCHNAIDFIKQHFPYNTIITGKRGNPYPDEIQLWEGDYIISYLSPWIIKENLLNRSNKASINFHPGPPEYPGIGCTNFAIYDKAKNFGITCHHMLPKVDTGRIIQIDRFPLYETDSVYSLTQRCYAHILNMFYKIMEYLIKGKDLPVSNEKWMRRPYKRKELNELCKINPNMDLNEIKQRVKAVTFPGAPGAYIEFGNMKFKYDINPR